MSAHDELRDEIAEYVHQFNDAEDGPTAGTVADWVLAVPAIRRALAITEAAEAMYGSIKSPFGPGINQHYGAYEAWTNFERALRADQSTPAPKEDR